MLSGCSHHLSNEDAVRIYGLLRQGPPPLGCNHPGLLSCILTAMGLPPDQKLTAEDWGWMLSMVQRQSNV